MPRLGSYSESATDTPNYSSSTGAYYARPLLRPGGGEVGTDGDGFFVVFARAADAVAAAADAQIGLGRHPWPEGCTPLVRMGVHTGKACLLHGDYVGLDVVDRARLGRQRKRQIAGPSRC